MILINDIGRHAASVRGATSLAVERVLASGWFILGQEGAAFEAEFAAFVGADYCIGVANGTDAIELGLRALGVGVGGRVATVANAAFYTSTAVLAIGAEPVYIDVDRTTHLMDLDDLEKKIALTPVDAIVVTHLYGLMHDMAAIMALAARAGVFVLEDCAQAHGARRGAMRAGACGHAASFSFYPTKNLGALGDGGAVTTSDAALAQRVRSLRQYGWEGKYHVALPGARNSRLDEIQAAVLRAKLPLLQGWNERRQAIARRYSEHLVNRKIACPPLRGDDYVAHLYVVTTDDRDGLKAYLAEAGIASDVHYPVPDHHQAPIRARQDELTLPATELLAGRVLTLPCFPELTDEEVDRVIDRVNAW